MNAHVQVQAPPAPSWTASPFWQGVRAAPHAHDLFHLLRWLDARGGAGAPLGRAPHPDDEPVRLGQQASLSFAPAMIAALQEPQAGPPQLSVLGFGLFGPNGALPLHLTEYARERERAAGDPTLTAFADLFHHRLTLLFYRAWADAQATVGLDRPDAARFDTYVASLLSMGLPAQQQAASSSAVGLHARYSQAGHLVRQSRNPEGLVAILRRYLDIPVRLQENQAAWVPLPPQERMALGGRRRLGEAAVGRAVRDAQSRFRLVLGPLTLDTYRQFLPGGALVPALVAWVDDYVGLDLGWDVQLELLEAEAPRAALAAPLPLGLCTWLGRRGSRPHDTPAAGVRRLIIDYRKRAQAPFTTRTTS